ncbi:NmrA family NAD(P)-binding protein [Rhizobium oryzicola]|uniref:NmrA family NAD(P)-binding protein n=1 Tax=Rhizobium oryzicola TaxID=1232668 RepID=A0ABT8SZN8_9HYPH|nr:NmrA family NAD(P)-binding protein [Rhizobium oryzicola]MDO1583831.1 NmrA family NAD(P)-binding protein [Rhizobium oryzicola]
MSSSVLVTGATGRLGQLVTRRLIYSGDRVRVLTRRPDEARRLWGDAVDIAQGDFQDRSSLMTALNGIDRFFLLSPINENLAAHQIALINAAADAGVRHIVKISGSIWTIENSARSRAGAQHRQVEAHLVERGLSHAVIRPNAWMQVSLAPVIAAALAGNDLPARYAGAAVSFIDISDIADVAARTLHAGLNVSEPLVLTGAKAFTSSDIAGLVSAILRRPVGIDPQAVALSPGHDDAFAAQAVREFGALIAEGLAAPVTDTVERVLGRKPVSLRRFLEQQLVPAKRQPEQAEGDIQWQ